MFSSSNILLLGGLSVAGLTRAQAPAVVTEAAVVSLAAGAVCACTQLASQFGAELLGTNSTNYAAEAINYWDIRADLAPQCIFMPSDADEVAAGVSIIVSCGAQFAVRGGGHMAICRDPSKAGPRDYADMSQSSTPAQTTSTVVCYWP